MLSYEPGVARGPRTRPGARRTTASPGTTGTARPNGYVEPTNAFYFKALCWMNALRALSGDVLHRLGEACHAARAQIRPPDSEATCAQGPGPARYAFQSFLGDPYLAALLETSEANLRDRLTGFYEVGTPAKSYPGYRLYAPFDHVEGDPKRPLNAPGDRYRHQRRLHLPRRVELESQSGAGSHGRLQPELPNPSTTPSPI